MTWKTTIRHPVYFVNRLIRALIVRSVGATLLISSIVFMTVLFGFHFRKFHTIQRHSLQAGASVIGSSASTVNAAAAQAAGGRLCAWNITDTASSSCSSSLSSVPWASNLSSMSVVFGGGRERLMFSILPGSSARFGNQLFGHASLLGVAYCMGYRPVVYKESKTNSMIQSAFSLKTQVVDRVNRSRPIRRWTELQVNTFTPPKEMTRSVHNDTSAADWDVELVGYLQSWRYFADVTDEVMADFRFKQSIADAATQTIERLLRHRAAESTVSMTSSNVNGGTLLRTVLVGIHARRTDMAAQRHLTRGYTVADEKYFHNAMKYIEKHVLDSSPASTQTRIVYVVCSDDRSWARTNIVSHLFPVIHSDGDHAVDMAVLASCDHVIMSTGTYGWWGGYLAANKPRRDSDVVRRLVIYYAGFPPPNSEVGSGFRPSDVYPPSWIGLM